LGAHADARAAVIYFSAALSAALRGGGGELKALA
jgi:hypothetical protein